MNLCFGLPGIDKYSSSEFRRRLVNPLIAPDGIFKRFSLNIFICKCIAFLFFSMLASQASAEGTLESITSNFTYSKDNGKGSALSVNVQKAYQLIKDGRLDEATIQLKSVQESYEKLFNKSTKQYTFQSKEDFQQYKINHNEDYEWIDWGYEQCLQLQAFILSEKKIFNRALDLLEDAMRVAPIAAQVYVETAYIKNALHMTKESYDLYAQAVEISKKYPSQRPFLAPALRGMGTTLIDLNRLDEAELRFRESLKSDPNSNIAIHELQYIENLRKH